jgi:hypothetical protein
MKVILKRGIKGDKEFAPESAIRARQRAESLGWLHNVEPKEDGDTIVVDATTYYDDTFVIEYYEGASSEWYQYGEGKFPNRGAGELALAQLVAIDEYSAKLNLRVRRI